MEPADIEAHLASFGPVTSAPISKTQAYVAGVMARNASTIPHVTHHDDVDVTAIEGHRKALAAAGTKVTPLAFLIRAVVAALQEFPRFNSSLAGDRLLVSKQYYHVGVAVDGPLGLLVPVLRDCDQKSVIDLATEIAAISEKARGKGLSMAEMSGGCFSISSLGGIGGTAFTPIINAPEVAILGVTRTVTKPVWDGNAFAPRQMMPLSLSYDHRVINGADAARFVRFIGDRLAEPEKLG